MKQNPQIPLKNPFFIDADKGMSVLSGISWRFFQLDYVIRKSKKRFPTLRKRKFYILLELWGIEQSKGYFTPQDLSYSLGWGDWGRRIMPYWDKLIRENWFCEVDNSKRVPAPPGTTAHQHRKARVTPFFLTVGLTLLESMENFKFLGPVTLLFDGGLVKACRLDCGWSVRTAAARLEWSECSLTQVERGLQPISWEKNKKIIEVFYHKIHPRYWTEEVKQMVKDGVLPWPHFEYQQETNWWPSKTTKTEFERIDRPRIDAWVARKEKKDQETKEELQAIKDQQKGKFKRQDFFDDSLGEM